MTIRAGDIVIPAVGAANRDPEVFPHPDTPDVDRVGPRHLSFGAGAHACIGMALARLELLVTLRELSRALPDLTLGCAVDELSRSHPELPVNPIERIPLRLSAVTH